jgi:phosphatidylglycerol:prolipoprotein diacylglycerol transferase
VYLKIAAWDRALGSVFALMPGTEIGWVGCLAAVGVAMFLARRWRLSLLAVADSYAAGLAVMGIAVGAAALLGGDMVGIQTNLPWAIDLWGLPRHPTQIYFALACLAILIILWRVERRQGGSLAPGMLGQLFLIGMGITLLLIEPLRADSPTLFGGIRTLQVIGLAGITAALAGFATRAPAVEPA